jgi:hypothetical protein
MAIVEQVKMTSTPKWNNLEEYFDLRQWTIGVRPGFVYTEYVYALNLTEEIFTNNQIQELENAAIKIIILYNDLLSYHTEGPDHLYNADSILRKLYGYTVQESYDKIDVMIQDCYTTWNRAMERLPSWGEDIDVQVQLYIKGIKGHVSANANWSFGSKRYFGDHGAIIKETGRIRLATSHE